MARYSSIVLAFLLFSVLLFSADVCEGESKTVSQMFVSADPAKKTIDSVFFYEDAVTSLKYPIAHDRIWVWIYSSDQASGQVTKEIVGLLTDSEGKISLSTASNIKDCTTYRFIYCPISYSGDGKAPVSATELSESTSCLALLKPSTMNAPANSELTYSDKLSSLEGITPPANYLSPPAPFSSTYEETQYCPPKGAYGFAFCMPLVIIFALLGGALYLSGKNPLSGFDFTAPRMGKHVKYSPSGRGASMDVGGMMSALGSSGRDIYSVKVKSQISKESSKEASQGKKGAEKPIAKGDEGKVKMAQESAKMMGRGAVREGVKKTSGEVVQQPKRDTGADSSMRSSALAMQMGLPTSSGSSGSIFGNLPIIGLFTQGKQTIKDFDVDNKPKNFRTVSHQVVFAVLMRSNLAPFLAPLKFGIEVSGGTMYNFLQWFMGAIGGVYMWSNQNALKIYEDYGLTKGEKGKVSGKGAKLNGQTIGFTFEDDGGIKVWVKNEKGEWVEAKKDSTTTQAFLGAINDFEKAARTVSSQYFGEWFKGIQAEAFERSGITKQMITDWKTEAEKERASTDSMSRMAELDAEIGLYNAVLGKGDNLSPEMIIAARVKLLVFLQEASFERNGAVKAVELLNPASYGKDISLLKKQEEALDKLGSLEALLKSDSKYIKFFGGNPLLFQELKQGKNVEENLAKLEKLFSQKGTALEQASILLTGLSGVKDAMARLPEHSVIKDAFRSAQVEVASANASLQAKALYDPEVAAFLEKRGSLISTILRGNEKEAIKAMESLYSYAEALKSGVKEGLPSFGSVLNNETSANVFRLRAMEMQISKAGELAATLETFRNNISSDVSERDNKIEKLTDALKEKEEKLKEAKTPIDSLRIQREISDLKVDLMEEKDKYSSAVMETAKQAFGAMRAMAFTEVTGELVKRAASDKTVTDDEKMKVFLAATVAQKEMSNSVACVKSVSELGVINPDSHYLPQYAADYKSSFLFTGAFGEGSKEGAAKSMEEIAGQIISGKMNAELSAYSEFMDGSIRRNSQIAAAAGEVRQTGEKLIEVHDIKEGLARQYMEKKGEEILKADGIYHQGCENAKEKSFDPENRKGVSQQEFFIREKYVADSAFSSNIKSVASDAVVSSVRNGDEKTVESIMHAWEHAEIKGESEYSKELEALKKLQESHDNAQKEKLNAMNVDQLYDWVRSNARVLTSIEKQNVASVYSDYLASPNSEDKAEKLKEAIAYQLPDKTIDSLLGIDSDKYADYKKISSMFSKMQTIKDEQQEKEIMRNNYVVLQATAAEYRTSEEYKNLNLEQKTEFNETLQKFVKEQITGRQFAEFVAEKLPDKFADSFAKTASTNTSEYMDILNYNKEEYAKAVDLVRGIANYMEKNGHKHIDIYPNMAKAEFADALFKDQELFSNFKQAEFLQAQAKVRGMAFEPDMIQSIVANPAHDKELNKTIQDDNGVVLAKAEISATVDRMNAKQREQTAEIMVSALEKSKKGLSNKEIEKCDAQIELLKPIISGKYDTQQESDALKNVNPSIWEKYLESTGKSQQSASREPASPEFVIQELAILNEFSKTGDERARTIYKAAKLESNDLKTETGRQLVESAIDYSNEFAFLPNVSNRLQELGSQIKIEETKESDSDTEEKEDLTKGKSRKKKKS